MTETTVGTTSHCEFCGEEIVLTERGWSQDTQFLNTTPEESADMSRQCGLAPGSLHQPCLACPSEEGKRWWLPPCMDHSRGGTRRDNNAR